MNKELREAVARAVMVGDGCGYMINGQHVFCDHCSCFAIADAAISIIRPAVLEEAAKVAERNGKEWVKQNDFNAVVACRKDAEAIRALAKEGE